MRPTRITCALAARNPERAIQARRRAAPDWSRGPGRRRAARVQRPPRTSRHGPRRRIVILSDAWERGDPMLVGREMERLARLAHRIVRVNPRVSAGVFSVRAGGERPRCRIATRSGAATVPGPRRGRRGDRGRVVGPPELADGAREAAAGCRGRGGRAVGQRHAGPAVRSGMPSGYGPSRGNITRVVTGE